MPTEPVVEGYEQLLGLPRGELMSVLEAACFERHGDAWTKRRSYLADEIGWGRRPSPPSLRRSGIGVAGSGVNGSCSAQALAIVLLASAGLGGWWGLIEMQKPLSHRSSRRPQRYCTSSRPKPLRLLQGRHPRLCDRDAEHQTANSAGASAAPTVALPS